jgi:hypothetical protein
MRLDKQVREALEQTGLPWEIVNGGKHAHLRVDGQFVSILPYGSRAVIPRAVKNCVPSIRRVAQGRRQDGRRTSVVHKEKQQ